MKIRILSFFKFILIIALVIVFIRFINGYRYDKLREYKIENFNDYSKELNKEDPLKSKFTDIDISEISGNYIYGYHLLPHDIKHQGIVITFGGSEGSSNLDYATLIAENGYEVLSLYFFGQQNQNKELVNIPLDFFQEVIDYIVNNGNSNEPITVLGGSKGAELALVLSTIYPEIDNLVLFAPSSHVFQGLSFTDREPHSSWTYKGEELNYLSFMDGDIQIPLKMLFNTIFNIPISHLDSYGSLLKDNAKSKEARIPIEKFQGEALIFAGKDDKMWPSADMASEIKKVLEDRALLYIYEDVGHLFLGPPVLENLVMGGKYDKNVKARLDSNKILIETLEKWHN